MKREVVELGGEGDRFGIVGVLKVAYLTVSPQSKIDRQSLWRLDI